MNKGGHLWRDRQGRFRCAAPRRSAALQHRGWERAAPSHAAPGAPQEPNRTTAPHPRDPPAPLPAGIRRDTGKGERRSARPCGRQRAISSEWRGAGREEPLIEEEPRQCLLCEHLLIARSSRCGAAGSPAERGERRGAAHGDVRALRAARLGPARLGPARLGSCSFSTRVGPPGLVPGQCRGSPRWGRCGAWLGRGRPALLRRQMAQCADAGMFSAICWV